MSEPDGDHGPPPLPPLAAKEQNLHSRLDAMEADMEHILALVEGSGKLPASPPQSKAADPPTVTANDSDDEFAAAFGEGFSDDDSSQNGDQDGDQDGDQSGDQGGDQDGDQDSDQDGDQGRVQGGDQDGDQDSDQDGDQGRVQGGDQDGDQDSDKGGDQDGEDDLGKVYSDNDVGNVGSEDDEVIRIDDHKPDLPSSPHPVADPPIEVGGDDDDDLFEAAFGDDFDSAVETGSAPNPGTGPSADANADADTDADAEAAGAMFASAFEASVVDTPTRKMQISIDRKRSSEKMDSILASFDEAFPSPTPSIHETQAWPASPVAGATEATGNDDGFGANDGFGAAFDAAFDDFDLDTTPDAKGKKGKGKSKSKLQNTASIDSLLQNLDDDDAAHDDDDDGLDETWAPERDGSASSDGGDVIDDGVDPLAALLSTMEDDRELDAALDKGKDEADSVSGPDTPAAAQPEPISLASTPRSEKTVVKVPAALIDAYAHMQDSARKTMAAAKDLYLRDLERYEKLGDQVPAIKLIKPKTYAHRLALALRSCGKSARFVAKTKGAAISLKFLESDKRLGKFNENNTKLVRVVRRMVVKAAGDETYDHMSPALDTLASAVDAYATTVSAFIASAGGATVTPMDATTEAHTHAVVDVANAYTSVLNSAELAWSLDESHVVPKLLSLAEAHAGAAPGAPVPRLPHNADDVSSSNSADANADADAGNDAADDQDPQAQAGNDVPLETLASPNTRRRRRPKSSRHSRPLRRDSDAYSASASCDDNPKAAADLSDASSVASSVSAGNAAPNTTSANTAAATTPASGSNGGGGCCIIL
ncbi:uncharacterized protein AMSG_04567 [Thecamonas trahens ATCC 50062]|uniref:Uncharacterized protein n=1 Tax=Thecamonas trahens ATCC 50062 TaxID=461836 RepID=A0A0L0D8W5_THETB|nr:hypothetical protein AMSG_04567 [Thecamonas trahens ATCC 50062]KNC48822.1 hypothetical protein AMSG_04567 [Thecamonas trahens ATCC 50062]|eukprot:XP_013758242.1 hypothetical protein AMSG_04567 [Thecamonas trahens ATCC 50062]